jgi:hypothetical protein
MTTFGKATFLALFAVSACRSPNAEGHSRPQRLANVKGDQYLIEGDEMSIAGANNLYELVRIQRPFWVSRNVGNASGDQAVLVYLDDRPLGSLSILRDLQVHVARRLRYLAPTEARIRFGPSHGNRAAIVVESAKPER